ncbi:MAG: universal stress protein [Syntrophales bacterium]|jgi:nucleotide-binding universal stress UspA family protein
MFAPKKILVPTDFSKYADKALKEAIDITNKYGSKIYLLHVIDEHIQQCAVDYCIEGEVIKKLRKDSLEASKQKLQEGVNAVAEAKKLDVRIDVKEGIPAEVILSEQKKKGIDLIVIASHGKTGILKNLLGSVTDKVVRGSKCPIMVVKP